MSEYVIDRHDKFQHFHMCQIIARLKIEVGTGLGFKTPTLKVAKQVYGIPAGTKAKALEQMLELYKNTYGWDYGSGK